MTPNLLINLIKSTTVLTKVFVNLTILNIFNQWGKGKKVHCNQ